MRRKDFYKTIIKELATCRHLSFFAIFFILYSLYFSPARAQIGTWRNYISYNEPQQIVKAGDVLFVRASNGLYQYNLTDHSIVTYDKNTGLSDTYITHIAWNQQAKRLIAVYQNSNIDLVEPSGNIINISAIYRKAMTEDKTIDSLTIDGPYAYLYARFGIVKVNMQRAEISDTYTENHPEYPTQLPVSNINADWDQYINIVNTLKPGGPDYNYFGFLRMNGRNLYSVDKSPSSINLACIQSLNLDTNEWTTYDNNLKEKTGHEFSRLYCIDIDPNDANHFFAGGRTGLYEYKDGLFVKEYNNDNSPLKTASTVGNDNKDYVLVTGLKFDSKGSLWCANSISPSTSLLEYNTQSEWVSHHHKELMVYDDRSFEGMEHIIFDSRGLMWFVNNYHRTPALICYNPNTDQVKVYKTFINQDGTTYNISYVTTVVEDKSANIWIGTNLGPFMLDASTISAGGDIFTQVKIPRNDGSDYADYLLSGVYINTIAVDGGGRKWFGTNENGVYLLSEDNLTQLQHFQANNTPLLSDNITALAIDDLTGEVFIATNNGLCSYKSDATIAAEEMTKDNVYAYPNPVTPEYTGLITIVGLSYQAHVKIVTSSGKLVNEGQSNGGTYTWNGCDQQGRRVSSGVYHVLTAKSNADKGTVCRIAIIN